MGVLAPHLEEVHDDQAESSLKSDDGHLEANETTLIAFDDSATAKLSWAEEVDTLGALLMKLYK